MGILVLDRDYFHLELRMLHKEVGDYGLGKQVKIDRMELSIIKQSGQVDYLDRIPNAPDHV